MKSRRKYRSNMPKLPVEQTPRDSELLEKASWKTGAISAASPKEPAFSELRDFSKTRQFKLGLGLALALLLTIGVYFAARDLPFFKNLFPGAGIGEKVAFEYPIDTSNTKYPGFELQEKFLEDMRNAASEKDEGKRYKYLEDGFSLLQGFYASTGSYDYRVQLEKYREYMKKNYPRQFEANKSLYEFACIDKLCGEAKYPSEIAKLNGEIAANGKIDPLVKAAILRNLDGAAFTGDKDTQANFYVGAMSMLISEVNRTGDMGLKSSYLSLFDFIVKNYPEVSIPDQLKLKAEGE